MRINDGRVVPTLLPQALKGEDLTVFGDGSQTRSFCYVSDLVEGIWRLLFKTDYKEPVNLGNPQEMSILDFAKAIVSITGSPSKIVFQGLPPDDPKVRQPDITLARNLLDWEPKVTFEEGIRKTLAHFRETSEVNPNQR